MPFKWKPSAEKYYKIGIVLKSEKDIVYVLLRLNNTVISHYFLIVLLRAYFRDSKEQHFFVM